LPAAEDRIMITRMATIDQVGKLALDLPEIQRAMLATQLLESLSPVLHDEDDGLAEAMRRDAEMNENPSIGVQFKF